MPLDPRNMNIYGLGVGILIVFEIFSNFPFQAGRVDFQRPYLFIACICPL
jgi:hypothetical protein